MAITAPALLLWIVAAAPQEHAVGIGAALKRAVIGVAQGEGIGQRVLERQVRLLEVPHGVVLLIGGPGVHHTLAPGVLRI